MFNVFGVIWVLMLFDLDGIGIVVARLQCAVGHGECGIIFLTFVIHNQRQGCNCLREEDDR